MKKEMIKKALPELGYTQVSDYKDLKIGDEIAYIDRDTHEGLHCDTLVPAVYINGYYWRDGKGVSKERWLDFRTLTGTITIAERSLFKFGVFRKKTIRQIFNEKKEVCNGKEKRKRQ